jgi:hypothetical protein
MADKALRTPFTFHLHVADFPDNVGVGVTPAGARAALESDLRRDLGADAEPVIADVLSNAFPLTVTAESARDARRALEGLLGVVRAARVLATLPGVL